MMGGRSVAIIGVVGKTVSTRPKPDNELTSVEKALLLRAEQIGVAIASRKQVILTGGHHLHLESSVKFRALAGAASVVSQIGIARLIGILPMNISAARGLATTAFIDPHMTEPLRSLYFHTQLRSELRNPLTGQAVDVMIALDGGTGTAQEVIASLESVRHVIFLDSWSSLRKWIPEQILPATPLQATRVNDAVDIALNSIDWGKSSQQLNGALPAYYSLIPDYERLRQEYESEVGNL